MTLQSRATAAGLILIAALLLASPFSLFYFRDAFSTHYPLKVLSADYFRAGEIPFWNFHAGGGQPLAGNPNTLTFYPDNILYLLLPAHLAFNLHFILHLAAGFFAMRAFTLRLGVPADTAAFGALLYLVSGVAVSLLAFYNLVVAFALVPLILAALHDLLERPGVRRALLLGAAGGLLALAGEPVTFAGTALLALVVAAPDLRLRSTVWISLSAVIAVAIASPLLLAWSDIAGNVERAGFRYSTATVLAASLRPTQLLELAVGPFPGNLLRGGAEGLILPAGERWPPLFPSVFIGTVVIPAFFVRARFAWRLRIALAFLLFLALGRFNPVVVAMLDAFPPLRIGRYPEKFAIQITVVAIVLVSLWLAKLRDGGERRTTLAFSLLALLAGAGLAAVTLDLTQAAAVRLVAGVVTGGAIFATAAMVRRRRAAFTAVLLLTIAAPLWWFARMLPIDRMAHYASPSPVARIASTSPRVWRPMPTRPHAGGATDVRARYRIAADFIDPLFGLAFDVRYGLDPSPEGMYSFFSRLVRERVDAIPLSTAIDYARLHAIPLAILDAPVRTDGAVPIGAFASGSDRVFLHRIEGARAMIFAPDTLYQAASIQEAVAIIESARFNPLEAAVVPERQTPVPSGEVAISEAIEAPNRISFTAAAARPALVVVNQTWFPAWRAWADRRALETVPVDIDRLGVVVPAGTSRVTLAFGRRNQLVTGAIFVSGLLLLAALAAASKNAIADPAR